MCPPPYRHRTMGELLLEIVADSPELQRLILGHVPTEDRDDWLDYVGDRR